MRNKNTKSARKNRHSDLSKRIFVKNEAHLFESLKDKKEPLLLILDEIQDPHNLGACLRTADAAGVDAVIVPKDRAVSLTETVRKIACGGAENIMFIQATNIASVIRKLKESGVWIVGTSDRADRSIYQVDLKGGIAIIIGSEAKGMRKLTTDLCDFLVSIPMRGKVECLNASVATGVCLFEALRQRETDKK